MQKQVNLQRVSKMRLTWVREKIIYEKRSTAKSITRRTKHKWKAVMILIMKRMTRREMNLNRFPARNVRYREWWSVFVCNLLLLLVSRNASCITSSNFPNARDYYYLRDESNTKWEAFPCLSCWVKKKGIHYTVNHSNTFARHERNKKTKQTHIKYWLVINWSFL